MNEIDIPQASDDQILDGVRRRMSGVEPLVPLPRVWQHDPTRREVRVSRGRLNAHVRPAGAVGFGGVLAVLLITVVIGMSLAHQGPFYGAPAGAQASPSGGLPQSGYSFQLQARNGVQPTAADVTVTVGILSSRASLFEGDLVAVGVGPSDAVEINIGGPDPGSVIATLIQTGHLDLVPLPRDTYGSVDTFTGVTAPGTKVLPAVGDTIDPSLPARFTGSDLDRSKVAARYENASAAWLVDFAFKGAVGTDFATWSGNNVGNYFAVVLDGRVLEAPFIQSAITTGQASLGNFSSDEAKELAGILRSGELPFPLQQISSTTSTPTAQTSIAIASIVTPTVHTSADIPSNGRTLGNPTAPVTMDVWIDFRCSACADFATGTQQQVIDKYVKDGRVKLVYHDFIVIDLRDQTHASEDAANAAKCAADQGKYWAYADWLWANQDPQEAAGAVSRDRLIEVARRVGLDVTAFQACYDAGTHRAAIRTDSASAAASSFEGTPTILVNGQVVGQNGMMPDFATVSAAIDLALAAAPSASASN
jgi:protein-disulfide isomerase